MMILDSCGLPQLHAEGKTRDLESYKYLQRVITKLKKLNIKEN